MFWRDNPLGSLLDMLMLGGMFYAGSCDGKKRAVVELESQRQAREIRELRQQIDELKAKK